MKNLTKNSNWEATWPCFASFLDLAVLSGRCCIVFLCLFLGILFAGCDRKPDEVYVPPSFAGKAYVLAESDHVAVLDFASERLTRIKLGKKGVDLEMLSNRLYVLAEDGSLAAMDPAALEAGNWQKVAGEGRDLTIGPEGSLWILGGGEVVFYQPGKGVTGKKKLPVPADYLFFEAAGNRLWCIDRQKSILTAVNGSTFVKERTFSQVGNSVHDGFFMQNAPAAPGVDGTQEIWLAEGNEYMDGKPYGVGYVKDGPAMLGGVNVLDPQTGKQTDFIMVGGNVADLAVSPDKSRVYAAVSQRPDYDEATLTMLESVGRRVKAEFRLCDSCHLDENVTIQSGRALIRAMAVAWPSESERPEVIK